MSSRPALFVVPAVLIVTLGPAFIQLIRTFKPALSAAPGHRCFFSFAFSQCASCAPYITF